jgi:DNA invertase Pin-like site-specific DNA recombinase
MIRARIRAALAVKRARGERLGCIPFGFRAGPDGVHIEPDPSEQAIIDRVRVLASAGLSQRAIAGVLASDGVTGRSGRPLSQVQVHRMLAQSRLARAPEAAA